MGKGPLALCLHGFPDTPATWRLLLPELAEAGYRAVAVTSRGYEPTSQPADADYGMGALSRDVLAWMDVLEEERAHLIGHDWGSSIMHAVAARAPERVCSLTGLAVPHPLGFAAAVASDFEQLERSWYIFFFLTGAFANAVVQDEDFRFLERLWRKWSPGWDPPPEDLVEMRATFAAPGVKDAALSYYRTSFWPSDAQAAEAQALWNRSIDVPVLGVTGELDGCISPRVFRQSMIPSLYAADPSVIELPGAGHFLHLEQPRAVAEIVTAHLRSGSFESL